MFEVRNWRNWFKGKLFVSINLKFVMILYILCFVFVLYLKGGFLCDKFLSVNLKFTVATLSEGSWNCNIRFLGKWLRK